MEQHQNLTPLLVMRLAAPRTWAASVCPALFGELYCLLCGYGLTIFSGIALFCACVLMQSAVNTFNDYFDFVKGTDTADDCVEVSDAVLVYNHIAPRQALLLGTAFLVVAALLALPVILASGPVPLVIGVIGGLAVITYSGGSWPISYFPVGELVSGFVMGGLIPLGIVAAVTGRLDWPVLVAALPFIIGIALIMMSNNGSDIEKDRASRRCTLPAMLGRVNTLRVYRGAIIVWIVLLCLLPVLYAGMWGLLSTLFLLLFARNVFRDLLCSTLVPTHRIEQMKNIVKGNFLGNGAYLLTMAILLIGGLVHGWSL
ncbi:MAG: UbiA family prenyltransferase [Megasphaera sp.]|jgi:1,4-dihydroxy-2-naphthoate octaprenyltransferase|nr:UbiA family prenyltransferase [Megasphaera sp.]MCI1248540.1 UbiA family prenyltransferase [Megasphaera sp.]